MYSTASPDPTPTPPTDMRFFLALDNNICPKSSPVRDSGTENFQVPLPGICQTTTHVLGGFAVTHMSTLSPPGFF